MNKSWLLALLFSFVCVDTVAATPIHPENRCENSVALLFTPGFLLCKPLPFYKHAVILPAGEQTIFKFQDGGSFSSQILIPPLDGLPDAFDMRTYPEYALNLRDTSDLPQEIANQFRNSMPIIHSPDTGKPKISKQGKFSVYSGTSGNIVTTFVVDPKRKDLILLLQFHDLSSTTINSILEGLK